MLSRTPAIRALCPKPAEAMNPAPPAHTPSKTPRTDAAWSLYTNGQGAKAVRDAAAVLEEVNAALLAALEAQEAGLRFLRLAIEAGDPRRELGKILPQKILQLLLELFRRRRPAAFKPHAAQYRSAPGPNQNLPSIPAPQIRAPPM